MTSVALAGKNGTILMYLSNSDNEIKWESVGGPYQVDLVNEKKNTIYSNTVEVPEFAIYKQLKALEEPSGIIKVIVTCTTVNGVDGTFNYVWVNPEF